MMESRTLKRVSKSDHLNEDEEKSKLLTHPGSEANCGTTASIVTSKESGNENPVLWQHLPPHIGPGPQFHTQAINWENEHFPPDLTEHYYKMYRPQFNTPVRTDIWMKKVLENWTEWMGREVDESFQIRFKSTSAEGFVMFKPFEHYVWFEKAYVRLSRSRLKRALMREDERVYAAFWFGGSMNSLPTSIHPSYSRSAGMWNLGAKICPNGDHGTRLEWWTDWMGFTVTARSKVTLNGRPGFLETEIVLGEWEPDFQDARMRLCKLGVIPEDLTPEERAAAALALGNCRRALHGADYRQFFL